MRVSTKAKTLLAAAYILLTFTLTCPLWCVFEWGWAANLTGYVLAGAAFVAFVIWHVWDWVNED